MSRRPEVLPPENFAMVWKGVYRSGFPTKKNFAFLRQLQLRSVLLSEARANFATVGEHLAMGVKNYAWLGPGEVRAMEGPPTKCSCDLRVGLFYVDSPRGTKAVVLYFRVK